MKMQNKKTKRSPKKIKAIKVKNFKKKFRRNLEKTLEHLEWSGWIARFVASTVCAMLSTCAVWHKRIAQSSDENILVESGVKKLNRFFRNFIINYHCLGSLIHKLIPMQPGEKYVVILDRTNWDFGKKHINFLVAAVLFEQKGRDQQSAIPIAWEVLDKKGNSNTEERKRLMEKVIKIVGERNIKALLADREFIGDEWLHFLHENNVPFVIRIKKSMYVEIDGKKVNVERLAESVRYKQKLSFIATIKGIPIKLVITRSIDGDPVIAAASMAVTDDALDQYRKRWLIELFFKSIKTKGFNIEDTHMTDPERIKSLFALVAIASVCAVRAGIARDACKKITIKNHGRPEFSVFTAGLDLLKSLFRGTCPHWFKAAPSIFVLEEELIRLDASTSKMQFFPTLPKFTFTLQVG